MALGAEAKEAEWVWEEKERIGSTKLHKDRRCWRGAALRRLRHKKNNQDWNQVPGSWPLWAVHASAKTRATEAREVPLQNRFEHLAENDEGELPISMTSEELVPLMVESLRSGQCQNKRDRSVYVPRAKPRKSQKERKRASITPPGLLCPLKTSENHCAL